MAFSVEDGTGRSDANAYIDVSFADDYHLDRGNVDWTGADEEKAAWIVRATTYLSRWSANYKGYRTYATQALDWPRMNAVLYPRPARVGVAPWSLALYGLNGLLVDAFPSDQIPLLLKQATAELALRAKTGALTGDLRRGGRIKERIIGPITTIYADDAPAETTFPDVEALLAPLVYGGGGGGTVDLVRG